MLLDEHLQPFASRRAFIYVLEMLAQVFPVITFARRLPLHWLAFIDNVAGQFALMKGYGRALWEVGASAPPGTGTGSGAVCSAGRSLRYDQKGATAP